jgi:hypothetical protein
MTTETQTLKLDQIRIDGGTQPRVAIDEDVVAEYADSYTNGIELPSVTVFHDGSTYWLADGFHRYWASKRINCEMIAVDLHQGTRRDAILYSVGANASHGLRRTNDDKRKAIQTLLEDEEWCQWSNSAIAKQCGVSDKTVGNTRKIHTSEIPKYEKSEKGERTFIHHRTGKPSKMKTGKIGRPEPPEKTTSPSPAFAKDAYRPKASHSEYSPVPMRTVSLPLNNPQLAARCMISLYGQTYMRQLADEVIRIISHTEGTIHDCNPQQ